MVPWFFLIKKQEPESKKQISACIIKMQALIVFKEWELGFGGFGREIG